MFDELCKCHHNETAVLLWTLWWQVGTILRVLKEKEDRTERCLSLYTATCPSLDPTKEQEPSSRITILISDDMAAIAKLVLESPRLGFFYGTDMDYWQPR
jgi:hypothetical protein